MDFPHLTSVVGLGLRVIGVRVDGLSQLPVADLGPRPCPGIEATTLK